MNITLRPYQENEHFDLAYMIADLCDFHKELILGETDDCAESLKEAEESIKQWQQGGAVYMITYDETIVGFVHLGFRGELVTWLEDIYVKPKFRGKGIATKAIALAEEIVAKQPKTKALAIDVVPRNIDALKLYHKLGYVNFSMITLRKELKGENYRNQPIVFEGLEFMK